MKPSILASVSIVPSGNVEPMRVERGAADRHGRQSIFSPVLRAAARVTSTAAGTISVADIVAVEDPDYEVGSHRAVLSVRVQRRSRREILSNIFEASNRIVVMTTAMRMIWKAVTVVASRCMAVAVSTISVTPAGETASSLVTWQLGRRR